MPQTQLTPDAADATPDHKLTLRLWLRLLGCSTLVEKTVRARLAAEFDTTLPRFDVLAALERAPEGLQLGELSRALLVYGSDGRVVRVSLTGAGRKAFLEMAGAHEAWIDGMFEGLDHADQAELLTLLTSLRRVLNKGAKGSDA